MDMTSSDFIRAMIGAYTARRNWLVAQEERDARGDGAGYLWIDAREHAEAYAKEHGLDYGDVLDAMAEA